MTCISEPGFKECFSSIQKRCNSTEIKPRIASTRYIDCERLCNEDDNCKFVFYIPGRHCLKYPSCFKTQQARNFGSTYSKDGFCPGIKI